MLTIMSEKEQIRILREALEAAHSHLSYCGYGDSWERECAKDEGLDDKIQAALDQTK